MLGTLKERDVIDAVKAHDNLELASGIRFDTVIFEIFPEHNGKEGLKSLRFQSPQGNKARFA